VLLLSFWEPRANVFSHPPGVWKSLVQWFLTGHASPGGESIHFKGARTLMRSNMHSLINKLTNKYICLHNLFIVRGREIKANYLKGAWNKGSLLKGVVVGKRLRTTGLERQCMATCVRKYDLWRFFLLAWGVCEFTQNLSLESNYCLRSRVVTILNAFHSLI